MAFIEEGKQLGKLLITKKISASRAICKCECGTDQEYSYHKLHYGNTTCCGCTHTGKPGVKKNNQQAIALSKQIHGNETYGYDRFNYLDGKSKVELFCNVHQEYFTVNANEHLSQNKKSGCQKCSRKRRADFHRSSLEEFIARSDTVQKSKGRSFDYSRVDYKTARIHVEIGCNTCGHWFKQTPYIHTAGKGCPKCRDQKLAKDRSHTKDYFVQEAIKVVGDRYNFDNSVYKNARTYIDVLCNDCGEVFKKKPMEILNGNGCRCHAVPCGYKSHLPGNLYILKCEDMIKIGITNLSPDERAKVVSKSYGKTFEVVKVFNMDGLKCTHLETDLLRELRSTYKSPESKFDGYTETFYDVDLERLISRIEGEMLGTIE